MTNEMKNMPELRFPEFEGNWLSYALKDVKDPKDKYSFTGGPFGSDLKKSDYKDNGIRIIQLQNINDGNFNDNYKIYTSSEKADILKSCNIYPGDIVIAKMADPLARATILPQNKENRYLMASDAIRLKVDDKSFNKIFMVNYINSRRFRRQAEDNSSGSTRMRIGLVTLGQLKISSPNKKEQDIIGDFFSKLDRQIELEEQKLAKLEEQKKGYMQKIFSQELRFKDEKGNDYPEWKTKKLDELGEFNSGVGFPEKYQGGNTGVPFFKVSDMNLLGNEKFMNTANNYVSIEQIKQKKWKVIQSVPAIIFAKVGAAIMLNRKRMILNPFLIDNNTMSYSFFNHWDTNFGYVVFQMLNLPKYAQVGALPSYNSKDIGIIQIRLPIKEEQEKIGDFFSKLDEHIDKQSQKIDGLKLRKQGFLQKMFI